MCTLRTKNRSGVRKKIQHKNNNNNKKQTKTPIVIHVAGLHDIHIIKMKGVSFFPPPHSFYFCYPTHQNAISAYLLRTRTPK